MTKLSFLSGGQPVDSCPQAGMEAAALPADKWALLDALTHAREDFGLNHRTLGVLRALLTFFPERGLPSRAGAGVVFPSNRILSERLNGMPESTLRRHLAALVRSGLIARQDSANRKRFARFGGVVFGFDLSPLARFAAELFAASERALERRARVSALKAQIAATRQRLLDAGCEDPLLEDARLACRRKLSVEELETLVEALTETLNARLTLSQPTADMSARSNENERHIQTTDKSDSVTQAGCGSSDTPALGEVLETCKEYEALMPMDRRDWPALVSVAERLVPMMGVEPPVFREARARLGEERAAAVVLCMLETLESIRKPGAFLRAMGQRAERGTFNMDGMLRAVRAKRAGMAVA